jgi:DNA-binding transcriptional ArsR family regulator
VIDPTEWIVLSLMATGVNRATAEQVVADHDAARHANGRGSALREAADEMERRLGLTNSPTVTKASVLRFLRDRATAEEKATAPAAPATPTDTNRRARLLHEIAFDCGRWKSGDVVRWYQTQCLTGLGVRAARHDLAILRDSGAITQHDDKGVRFYTLNSRKDGSS